MSIPYQSLQSSKTSTMKYVVSTSVYMYLLHHHHRPHWCLWLTFYCATQICIARTCYGNVAGWVGGLLSDTRRYCIRTAKPILKRFWPSVILVSSDSCADTQFQGKPCQQGLYIYTRGGKLTIFDGSCRLSRKRYEIGWWLLWNVNRTSWVPYWTVSFLMTLSDP